jgi:hypothetical protein
MMKDNYYKFIFFDFGIVTMYGEKKNKLFGCLLLLPTVHLKLISK